MYIAAKNIKKEIDNKLKGVLEASICNAHKFLLCRIHEEQIFLVILVFDVHNLGSRI